MILAFETTEIFTIFQENSRRMRSFDVFVPTANLMNESEFNGAHAMFRQDFSRTSLIRELKLNF